MLLILIDHFVLLSALILILPWLFWSLHMHTLTTVYHSVWHVDSLACILPWSSFEHDVCITIRLDRHSLCGLEWYILYSAWPHVAWLPFFCLIACRLSVWAAHLSPYLQLSWFRSFLSSRFSLLQVWDLCVLALWPSQRLGVGSSDGLYRCTGAFWRRATLWCRLESDHWRPV